MFWNERLGIGVPCAGRLKFLYRMDDLGLLKW